MDNFNLEKFNKWFMDNIADDDGSYNKSVYEAAKWAWEEQQKKIDKVLELGYEQRSLVHYLVDDHINKVQGILE